jgi:hypothetical protein
MSRELGVPRESDCNFDPMTQQQVDDFCRRMSEMAVFNQKVTLLLAAYQMHRLKQDMPPNRTSHRQLLIAFSRRFASHFIEFSGLKYLHLLFRSLRRKRIGKNMDNQSSQRISNLIIDVVLDENHLPGTAPAYRPLRFLLSHDVDRSDKDE